MSFTRPDNMPAKMLKKNKQSRSRPQRDTPGPRPPLAFRPMPNMRVNLLFRQEKVLTESAAGLGAFNFYRVNGAFDPDQAALGPSALGFNQYAALFLAYRVHACRIRVEGVVNFAAASNAGMAIVTLTPNPRQVTLPADAALWGGEPGAISKTVTPQTVGGANRFILDKTYKPWDILKITRAQYMNETDYSSLVTTTPVKEVYVALTVNGVLAAGVTTLSAIVTISYEVEFFEPVLLV